MQAHAAGCPTQVADPPWKASPSACVPRTNPNGNFPSGVTFRLRTPEHVGIGVRVNEFKAPEVESYHIAAERRGQHFSRGHQYFDHYTNMQQRAQLLVPSLPRHSRVDDLGRLWAQRRHHESQREATLALMDFNERRRLERLRSTKSLLQHSDTASGVNRVLHKSLSAVELSQPFGGQTQALQLLNRRVDVNRLRRSRIQLGVQVAQQRHDEAQDKLDCMDQVFSDIADFEAANVPSQQLEAMRTTLEWTTALRPGAPLTPLAEVDEERCRNSPSWDTKGRRKLGGSRVRFQEW